MEQTLVRGILGAIEGAKLMNEEISEEEMDAELKAHDEAIAGMRLKEDGGLPDSGVLRRGLEAVEGENEGRRSLCRRVEH